MTTDKNGREIYSGVLVRLEPIVAASSANARYINEGIVKNGDILYEVTNVNYMPPDIVHVYLRALGANPAGLRYVYLENIDVMPDVPRRIPRQCECGAQYTSNPGYHLSYCKLSKGN